MIWYHEAQVGKVNRILWMIRRAFTYIDGYSMVKLYTALVRPRLEYGYPARSPLFKKDCNLLENVQRRATKMVPALKDMFYEERLEVLKLFSLFYRRARGHIIELYKHACIWIVLSEGRICNDQTMFFYLYRPQL